MMEGNEQAEATAPSPTGPSAGDSGGVEAYDGGDTLRQPHTAPDLGAPDTMELNLGDDAESLHAASWNQRVHRATSLDPATSVFGPPSGLYSDETDPPNINSLSFSLFSSALSPQPPTWGPGSLQGDLANLDTQTDPSPPETSSFSPLGLTMPPPGENADMQDSTGQNALTEGAGEGGDEDGDGGEVAKAPGAEVGEEQRKGSSESLSTFSDAFAMPTFDSIWAMGPVQPAQDTPKVEATAAISRLWSAEFVPGTPTDTPPTSLADDWVRRGSSASLPVGSDDWGKRYVGAAPKQPVAPQNTAGSVSGRSRMEGLWEETDVQSFFERKSRSTSAGVEPTNGGGRESQGGRERPGAPGSWSERMGQERERLAAMALRKEFDPNTKPFVPRTFSSNTFAGAPSSIGTPTGSSTSRFFNDADNPQSHASVSRRTSEAVDEIEVLRRRLYAMDQHQTRYRMELQATILDSERLARLAAQMVGEAGKLADVARGLGERLAYVDRDMDKARQDIEVARRLVAAPRPMGAGPGPGGSVEGTVANLQSRIEVAVKRQASLSDDGKWARSELKELEERASKMMMAAGAMRKRNEEARMMVERMDRELQKARDGARRAVDEALRTERLVEERRKEEREKSAVLSRAEQAVGRLEVEVAWLTRTKEETLQTATVGETGLMREMAAKEETRRRLEEQNTELRTLSEEKSRSEQRVSAALEALAEANANVRRMDERLAQVEQRERVLGGRRQAHEDARAAQVMAGPDTDYAPWAPSGVSEEDTDPHRDLSMEGFHGDADGPVSGDGSESKHPKLPILGLLPRPQARKAIGAKSSGGQAGSKGGQGSTGGGGGFPPMAPAGMPLLDVELQEKLAGLPSVDHQVPNPRPGAVSAPTSPAVKPVGVTAGPSTKTTDNSREGTPHMSSTMQQRTNMTEQQFSFQNAMNTPPGPMDDMQNPMKRDFPLLPGMSAGPGIMSITTDPRALGALNSGASSFAPGLSVNTTGGGGMERMEKAMGGMRGPDLVHTQFSPRVPPTTSSLFPAPGNSGYGNMQGSAYGNSGFASARGPSTPPAHANFTPPGGGTFNFPVGGRPYGGGGMGGGMGVNPGEGLGGYGPPGGYGPGGAQRLPIPSQYGGMSRPMGPPMNRGAPQYHRGLPPQRPGNW